MAWRLMAVLADTVWRAMATGEVGSVVNGRGRTNGAVYYRERRGSVTHETQGGSRLDRVEESVARGIDRGTDTVGNSYEDLNGVKGLDSERSQRRRR